MDGEDIMCRNAKSGFCFSCGKNIEYDPHGGMISDALIFEATGNYGSTIFDPMGIGPSEEYLEIHICDQCVKDRCQRVKHIAVRRKKEHTVRSVTFDAGGDIVFK